MIIENQLGTRYKPYFIIEMRIPKILLEKDIVIKFKKMNIRKETKTRFISCINGISKKKEEIKERLSLNPKKRRRKRLNNYPKITKNFLKGEKKGRKKKNDISKGLHDKYSLDNMINKIKNMINKSLILFCNKIIRSIYINKLTIKKFFSNLKIPASILRTKIIKDIDYNFISNKKKSQDILELLNMTVKDYLFNKLSPRYVNIPMEYNKLIINRLLLDNQNKEIFDLIFNNLKIGDWLEIFTYQKEFKDLINYKTLNKTQKKIIKDNLVRIEFYVNKLYEKDKIYFQCFIMLIYNFKRFLMIKEQRNRNGKEKNLLNLIKTENED